MTELLNVYSEINTFNWKMFMSAVLTFGVYVGSIVFLREYFDISYINKEFAVKVVMITVMSWLPLHLVQCVLRWVDPTEQ